MAKRKLIKLSQSLRSKADDILKLANEESEGESSSPSPLPPQRSSRPRAKNPEATAAASSSKRSRGTFLQWLCHNSMRVMLYLFN